MLGIYFFRTPPLRISPPPSCPTDRRSKGNALGVGQLQTGGRVGQQLSATTAQHSALRPNIPGGGGRLKVPPLALPIPSCRPSNYYRTWPLHQRWQWIRSLLSTELFQWVGRWLWRYSKWWWIRSSVLRQAFKLSASSTTSSLNLSAIDDQLSTHFFSMFTLHLNMLVWKSKQYDGVLMVS